MEFIWTSTTLSLAKLFVALGALGLLGWFMQKALKFNLERAIDALETNAAKGNALPLAIVLAAVVVTIGGILQRFL
jgi:hypothetical protein